MNIRQKVATLAIGIPDFRITLNDDAPPEYAEVVRQHIRETWRKNKWGRLFRRVLTQRFVGGIGFMAYLWDRKEGFTAEYVEPRDAIYDPTTVDATWDQPRWAARYVHVPRDVAEARYGKEAFEGAEVGAQPLADSPYNRATKHKSTLQITLYWDETTEAELYGSNLLRAGKNLYGRVPLRTLLGDVNPNGDFPLSDYDTSLGIFEMQRRLQNIINNVAHNGGGVPWMRSEYVDEKIRQKVINGTHQGYVLLSGVPGEQAIGYTPNQPLSPAVLEAMRLVASGLDADQGVTEYDRGVVQTNPKFATQAALLARSSGGRGNLARIDYEQFVESVVREMVTLTAKFGLDPLNGEQTDEAEILWEAYKAVTDIRVLEESGQFKDPALLQQQNMQLLQLATQIAMPMAQTSGVVPNLQLLFDDCLRSFDKRELERYYIQAAPPPMQGGAPGGQAGAAGSPGGDPDGQGQGNPVAPDQDTGGMTVGEE